MSNIDVAKVCPRCGQTTHVDIPADKYSAWKYEKILLQRAWPEGSATERETLISGLCPVCQEIVFGNEIGVPDNEL